MRTKITIVFETHGLGTPEQHNDWTYELSDKVVGALGLPSEPEEGQEDKYPLVTFDIVSVEKLAEDS